MMLKVMVVTWGGDREAEIVKLLKKIDGIQIKLARRPRIATDERLPYIMLPGNIRYYGCNGAEALVSTLEEA
jgi:hypothetical protein